MKKIIDKYAHFVSYHPKLVLGIFAIFTLIMLFGSSLLNNKSMDYEDMLPEDYGVIKAFKMISQDFGGASSAIVLISIENEYPNSNEITSVCDPKLITYSKKLEDYLSTATGVEEVNGIGNFVYDYYGIIPNSMQETKKVCSSPGASRIVSQDESMNVITLILNEKVDSTELTSEVEQVVNMLNKPAGIKVSLVGDIFAESIVMKEIGPSMSKTSNIAMIGIILILFLIFRTIKGVALPLTTIIFGVLWAMGFMGLIGTGISTMTSGTISMIMGVGIDFGIQIMSRFSYELKKNKKRKAMEETIKGTLFPIFTTALACLIGFKAMGLGELTMMAEIGDVMSYGVVFCMLAAITIVPSLLVVLTKDKKGKNKKLSLKEKIKELIKEIKEKINSKNVNK
jgi:hydrophobe/amphiphile efflux-3 (HAE3) family protein